MNTREIIGESTVFMAIWEHRWEGMLGSDALECLNTDGGRMAETRREKRSYTASVCRLHLLPFWESDVMGHSCLYAV